MGPYQRMISFLKNNLDVFSKDIQKLINDLRLLESSYKRKILLIQQINALWKQKSPKMSKLFNELIEMNRKLLPTTKKLCRQSLGDEDIMKKVVEGYAQYHGSPFQEKYEQELKVAFSLFGLIETTLGTLQKIIKEQNDYLEKHGIWDLLKDWQEHVSLYMMMNDELNAYKTLQASLIQIHTILMRLPKERKTPKATYSIVEVLPSQKNVLFKRLYDEVYVEMFPDPTEREELKKFEWYTNRRYRFSQSKGFSHILILLYGSKPVGGAIFDFIACSPPMSMGALWFVFILKEHRLKGFPLFVKEIEKVLYHDAAITGYKNLVGAFGEVNDAARMTPEQIAADSVNPKLRERLYRMIGFRKCAFNYIQPVLPPATEPVYYLSYYAYICDKRWKQQKKIPSAKFIEILYRFVEFGFGRNPSQDPVYKAMENDLRTKQFVELV